MNKRSQLIIMLLIVNTTWVTPVQAIPVSILAKYKWPILKIVTGLAVLPFILSNSPENDVLEEVQLVLGTSNIFWDTQKSTSIHLLPTVLGITLIGNGLKSLLK